MTIPIEVLQSVADSAENLSVHIKNRLACGIYPDTDLIQGQISLMQERLDRSQE